MPQAISKAVGVCPRTPTIGEINHQVTKLSALVAETTRAHKMRLVHRRILSVGTWSTGIADPADFCQIQRNLEDSHEYKCRLSSARRSRVIAYGHYSGSDLIVT